MFSYILAVDHYAERYLEQNLFTEESNVIEPFMKIRGFGLSGLYFYTFTQVKDLIEIISVFSKIFTKNI